MARVLPRFVMMVLALAALGAGCATNGAMQQRENLLVEGGFKAFPAITSSQQWVVRNLPTDKVSTVVRQGKVYFVYPDPVRHVLFVGHESQYLNYMLKAQAQGYGTGQWDAAWGDWDVP